MNHAQDFEEAVVRAGNDPRDNDTIGVCPGAAAGAVHGRKGMPSRWIEDLSERTADRDDGKVVCLIEEPRRVLWGPTV